MIKNSTGNTKEGIRSLTITLENRCGVVVAEKSGSQSANPSSIPMLSHNKDLKLGFTAFLIDGRLAGKGLCYMS